MGDTVNTTSPGQEDAAVPVLVGEAMEGLEFLVPQLKAEDDDWFLVDDVGKQQRMIEVSIKIQQKKGNL
jgi:hypothetical protein